MIYGVKLSADSDFAAAYNAVDTYEAYGLALAYDNFTLSAPEPRTEYKTIRGMDGALDVSEAPQGYPVFENRTARFRLFKAVRPFMRWDIDALQALRTEFLARWQGQRVRITFPDDETHYWLGRISVGDLDLDNDYGFFDCTAVVYPYKLKNETTSVEITDLTTSWKQYELTNERRFVVPTITVTQNTEIQILAGVSAIPPVVSLALPSGDVSASYKNPDTLLISGNVPFQARLTAASASPYMEISYREGTL